MNYKIIIAMFVLLFTSVSACSCPPILENWLLPTFIAAFLALGIILIVYMFSKVTDNARLNVWVRTELGQIIFSIIIAVVILGAITWFCTSSSGMAVSAGMYSGGSPFSGNAYEISCNYLLDISQYSNDVMSLIRYNIGAGNIRASLNQFGCKMDEIGENPYGCAFAFLGGPATSWNTYASNYNYVSLFNTALNVATISFFNSLFLLYVLLYITSGSFFILLPIGIILRTIPFLRGLGGALIAIIVGLFLFLPFMLMLQAMIFAPTMSSGSGSLTIVDEGDLDFELWPITDWSYITDVLWWSEVPDFEPPEISEIFKSTTYVFLAGVFFPYLGFAGVILITRDLSKLLGEEVDLSRISRMI